MFFFAFYLEEVTQNSSNYPKEYEGILLFQKYVRSRYVNLENIPEYLKENTS